MPISPWLQKRKKSYNFHSVEKIFHDDFLSQNPAKWKLAEKAKLEGFQTIKYANKQNKWYQRKSPKNIFRAQ